MSKRILIVDDEPDICEILRFNLEMEGYDVEVSEAPLQLLPSVGQSTVLPSSGTQRNLVAAPRALFARGGEPLPDLILLDVMMTPKSGFEWAKELKADVRTAHIPIIFCTAKTLEEDLLQGFAIGSDDYICKPFRISEVKARVKAVLRRSPSPPPSPEGEGVDSIALNYSALPLTEKDSRHTIVYTPSPSGEGWGEGLRGAGIVLDLDRKECYVDGNEVQFTKLEFELLALLLSKPGQVFSREKILQTVWPSDTIVLDRTVDVNITRIRKKIGRYGENLRTKFGYGYMFCK